jgi:hypothetical protein
MLRWFALTVIGFFALYSAWHSHVTPLASGAPERTGWLFQQFGEQGIAVAMLLVAIVFILFGLVGMLRSARRLRAVRKGRIPLPQTASQRTPAGNKGRGPGRRSVGIRWADFPGRCRWHRLLWGVSAVSGWPAAHESKLRCTTDDRLRARACAPRPRLWSDDGSSKGRPLHPYGRRCRNTRCPAWSWPRA